MGWAVLTFNIADASFDDLASRTVVDLIRGNRETLTCLKESKLPVETRERAIAQVSRAIYDYFLFNPH